MPGEYEALVSVDIWTMIFAWCNLLILFLVLKKLLFKPIKDMIDKRQNEIDTLYKDANEDKAAAAEMKADYEQKLEVASKKSDEIIQDATRRAQLKGEEILKDAQDQATATLKKAEVQIEMEKKQAMNDIKNQVSDMAIAIASAVVERDVDAKENADIVDQFIENFGESK